MAKPLQGPHVKPGEIWVEIDRLRGARAHGYEPVETVWFSASGWRREDLYNPESMRAKGVDLSWAITGEIGPRPDWTPPPDIPFKSEPSPFQGPEFDWRQDGTSS